MGDMADYYMEQDMYASIDDIDLDMEHAYDEMRWVKRDGTIIKIKDMDYQHLTNTLRMLERNGYQDTMQYMRINEEIKRHDKKMKQELSKFDIEER